MGMDGPAWQATQDLWVQVDTPRFGRLWFDHYVHEPRHDPSRVPAGTRMRPPAVVQCGPPAGAYVCSAEPDDDRDVEDWLDFILLEAAGGLEIGATVRVRLSDDSVSRLIAPGPG